MARFQAEHVLEGVHCTIAIHTPASDVIVLRITGWDIGDLGDRPFAALREVLAESVAAPDRLQLFIDAREAQGPSVDVSAHWAAWLREHKERFRYVNMLTRSKFVQLTADFVQRFAQMGERMRIFTEAAAFDTALALATAA